MSSRNIRPISLNWEPDRCWAILRGLWIGTVEWECTVTCDSRTTHQEAESIWDRPVMRVFKVSNQLPFEKCCLLCLCDRYCVNAIARNPDYRVSARSARDFRESGCILKLIVWVLVGWQDRYDPVTYVIVWLILIAGWIGEKPGGRVRGVTYSYTDDMKGECKYM